MLLEMHLPGSPGGEFDILPVLHEGMGFITGVAVTSCRVTMTTFRRKPSTGHCPGAGTAVISPGPVPGVVPP